ncbi:MAG: 4-hydroxybenzoate octaprenyltransferase [Betaproteobacteria bacterium]|nr:4-hydroxybenzoate octaprenyltransferase [Betaproteobacteria bacterium]
MFARISDRLYAYEKLIRLDKPIGTLLLLWPTLWALWLSSGGRPDWAVVWIFVLGTVLMRSAGCAMNDFADRNFDGRVKRTQDRPLASGRVSPKEALIVAAVLALFAFALVWQLRPLVIKLSFAALSVAMTYPFAKRFISLPQAYLGVAFGFGIPMAYAAHQDLLPAMAWLLLAANIFWAMAYDTEYAMVDRDDDLKIGIKSSAILLGRFDVAGVMMSHALFFALLGFAGWWQQYRWPYFAGLALAAVLAAMQYPMIRQRGRDRCFKAFRFNNWVGGAIFLGCLFAY